MDSAKKLKSECNILLVSIMDNFVERNLWSMVRIHDTIPL